MGARKLTTSARGRSRLSHLDARGAARMVDVGAKDVSERVAVARAVVRLPPACRRALRAGSRKGDVLQVARLAGIQAAKRTDELIPLCHQVPLDAVAVEFRARRGGVEAIATARCHGRTGVEMEALVAASVAALTIYDMLKAVSHDIVIDGVELVAKRGGKRGDVRRRMR